jgi:hypothetical protein
MEAPLETEALLRMNLRTREEMEAWVEAQKKQILAEKREDEAQAQENACQTNDAQRRREALQQQHRHMAAGVFHALLLVILALQGADRVLTTTRRRPRQGAGGERAPGGDRGAAGARAWLQRSD